MRLRLTCATLVVGVAASALIISGCCRRSSSSSRGSTTTTEDDDKNLPVENPQPITGEHIHFSKVPIEITMPPTWKQSQNTASWLVFRPPQGGALVAMSGEKDCGVVEKRLYSAMHELGLTNVAWDGSRKSVYINGLRTTIAQGTAYEKNNVSFIKYALTRAAGGQGCLLTLYNVWKSNANYRDEADRIILSVATQH